MHIPDGYLGPLTYGTMFGIMAPLWAIASRKVRQSVKALDVPYLAVGAAFSLVVMMFVLPLPGGTTGHMSGATLVAILLGPWSALIAVSISIIIQALIMGDGGITAIGANCFNMAFIGSFVGFWIYTFIVKAGRFVLTQKATASADTTPPSLFLRALAAGIASYFALNLGACATALQLGLQPLLQSGAAQAGHYFPYPLKYALPATMLPHLTVVGALEAAGTVLVLVSLEKSGMTGKAISRCVPALLLAAAALTAGISSAHDYRIERKGDGFSVVYGHGEARLAYDPDEVKKITVLNAEGQSVPHREETSGKEVVIKPRGAAALILVACDSGYWSKTIYGWKNLPKRQASRVVEAVRSASYAKAILSWGEIVRRPLAGIRLDLVPGKNPFDLKPGEVLPVFVYYDGRPLPGTVIEGDHEKLAITDGAGLAKVVLRKGRQLLTVEHRERINNDPDADYLALTATLTFEVTK